MVDKKDKQMIMTEAPIIVSDAYEQSKNGNPIYYKIALGGNSLLTKIFIYLILKRIICLKVGKLPTRLTSSINQFVEYKKEMKCQPCQKKTK